VNVDPWEPIEGRCNARKSGGDGLCRNPAGARTDHKGVGACYRHGGATANGRKHAQRVHAEQAVQTFGLPRDVDPHTALLEELWRTAGHVAWLGQVVADLEQGSIVWGVTEHRVGEGPEGPIDVTTRKAAVNTWVELYQAERKHLTHVAAECVKAGIEERRTRLAEEQGLLLATVVRGILTDLGVADHPDAAAVVRRHFTAATAIEAHADA
jgi:hypothetical protein